MGLSVAKTGYNALISDRGQKSLLLKTSLLCIGITGINFLKAIS